MKTATKLFILLITLSANFSLAQVPLRQSIMFPNYDGYSKGIGYPVHPKYRDSYQMVFDYADAEKDTKSFVFPFNSSFSDTGQINYVAVSYNVVAGYIDNPATPVLFSDLGMATPYPSDLSVTFDSIYVRVTHENNSGDYDKFNLQLVKTDVSGTPSTSVSDIVWQHTDSSNLSLSPSGNWIGTNSIKILAFGPGQTAPVGQPLAAVFNYIDPSQTDSLGVVAAYLAGGGGAVTQSAFPTSWTKLAVFFDKPTQNAGITYTGTGAHYPAQNWIIFALTHFDYNAAVKDISGNISYAGIFPNVTDDETRVDFNLKNPSSVSVDLVDLNGRIVRNVLNGNTSQGQHSQVIDTKDLPNGMYMVWIQDGNGAKSISRLIVNH